MYAKITMNESQCGVYRSCTWNWSQWRFDKSILRNIIKLVAITCHILKLKCMHQIQFRLGLFPRRCWGTNSAPQTLYLDLCGLFLREKGAKKEGMGEGRSRNGGRRERVEFPPLSSYFDNWAYLGLSKSHPHGEGIGVDRGLLLYRITLADDIWCNCVNNLIFVHVI